MEPRSAFGKDGTGGRTIIILYESNDKLMNSKTQL